ncbi:MAG: N-acetylmuramoyl-L-alanine amidase [bacterium]
MSLAVTACAAAKYTVKSGDSLASIAKKHGTTADAIAKANKLADPDILAIGQELLIPASAVKKLKYPLPADLKKRLDNTKVVPGKWRYIVIHHSATQNGSVKSMDAYHRWKRHMENGLAYHFVIGNGQGMKDGEIAIGDRWKRQIKGGHLASTALNEKSIGICLVGNFNRRKPTPKQMTSLYALISYLNTRCRPGKNAVKTHRQINTKPTECPGKNFPTKTLLQNV